MKQISFSFGIARKEKRRERRREMFVQPPLMGVCGNRTIERQRRRFSNMVVEYSMTLQHRQWHLWS